MVIEIISLVESFTKKKNKAFITHSKDLNIKS